MKIDRDRALVAGRISTIKPHDKADAGVDDGLGFRQGGEVVQFEECADVFLCIVSAYGDVIILGRVRACGIDGSCLEAPVAADEIDEGGVDGDREDALFGRKPGKIRKEPDKV
jgi:hypothetical protein